MSFSQVPPEIVAQILIAAVQVRGRKRAVHLRYVCRSWAAIVLHAIFTSGILASSSHNLLRWRDVPFWRSRLLVHEALKPRCSRPLRIVRRVSEYIVGHQYQNGKISAASLDNVRLCMIELCEMPRVGMDKTRKRFPCTHRDERWMWSRWGEKADEDNVQFQQALLTAAAWLNEQILVDEILSQLRDRAYLICGDEPGKPPGFELIFGSPIPAAALRGNDDVLRSLLNALSASTKIPQHAKSILLQGAKGNHLSTVKLSFELEENPPVNTVVTAMEQTGSPAVFAKLLPLVKYHLENEQRRPTYYRDEWLPSCLGEAARAGNLDMIVYFTTTMNVVPSDWDPVGGAARHGHSDAIDYLLDKGFGLSQRTLAHAVRSGRLKVVHQVMPLVLKAKDPTYYLQDALTRAVHNADGDIVKCLLSHKEKLLKPEDIRDALRRAVTQDTESITTLLRAAVRSAV